MKKILVVEDDPHIQTIYKQKLTQEGFEVIQATNGNQAMEFINQKPDLIIIDIVLPGGMDGFDVIQKINESDIYKKIPVLVLTNLENKHKLAADMGVTNYLIKANTSINDVVKRIRELIYDQS